jgi:hypothetical protein
MSLLTPTQTPTQTPTLRTMATTIQATFDAKPPTPPTTCRGTFGIEHPRRAAEKIQTADSGGSRPVFRDDGAPLFRLIAAQGSD